MSKKLLLLLCLLGNVNVFLQAQDFNIATLWESGPPETRINIVFSGDGYDASEIGLYQDLMEELKDSFLVTSPYKEYKDFFNIYSLEAISNESGVSHPGTASNEPPNEPIVIVDNVYGSTFDFGGNHNSLGLNQFNAFNLISSYIPFVDHAFIAINGGSGGRAGSNLSYAGYGAGQYYPVALHEIGHTIGNLIDEYCGGGAFGKNVSTNNDPNLVPWTNWIGDEGIDIYPRCNPDDGSYKPFPNCKMGGVTTSPNCAVCKEGIVDEIYQLISPISNTSPADGFYEFSSSSVDFSIDLILPEPNTISVEWLLNGNPIGNGSTSVTVFQNQLTGNNDYLEVIVTDATTLSRVYWPGEGYEFSRQWNFNINPTSCEENISGFEYLGEWNNSAYYLSTETQSWQNAATIANDLNGHLTSIGSQTENDFLLQNISEIVFIGYNDAQTEGTFEWENNEALNFDNLNTVNSDSRDFGTMNFWNGEWALDNQYVYRKFIVEIPCQGMEQLPDFTITQVSGIPSTITPGGTLNFYFDLENIGTAPSTETITVTSLLSFDTNFGQDLALDGFIIDDIPIGTVADLSMFGGVPSTVAEGDYYILIIADINDTNQELNENNNIIAIPITVSSGGGGGECPDALVGLTELGEFNNSKYFISNDFSRPADAQLIAEENDAYLAVINDQAENDFIQQHISDMVYIGLNDEQNEGNLQWANGDDFIYDNIDPCGFCSENAEGLDYVIMAPWDGKWSFSSQWSNRKYVIEVPCDDSGGGLPDLTLSNVSGIPSNGEIGDIILASFDVNNIGTEAVMGNYTIAAYLSTDASYSVEDTYLTENSQSNTPIGTLPNMEILFTIPEIANGNYYIILVADVSGVIQELNTNNNELPRPFVIGPIIGDCPDALTGFTFLGEYGSSNYFISNDIATPIVAQQIAEQNNGHLAIINNPVENEFIYQQISDMAYIGLNDAQTEGTLEWGNTGVGVTYENFDICSFCNDNSTSNDYVVMHSWNGGWSWSSQWNQRKYIIEIPCIVIDNELRQTNPVIAEIEKQGHAIRLKRLMPNPAMDQIFVSLYSPLNTQVDLQIFDARRGLVKLRKVNLQEGDNTISLSIEALSGGIYILRVPQAQTKHANIHFVKVKK